MMTTMTNQSLSRSLHQSAFVNDIAEVQMKQKKRQSLDGLENVQGEVAEISESVSET
eukprot:UN05864